MGVALQTVGGMAAGLFWLGLPVSAITFLLIYVGRRLGGLAGMQAGAFVSTLGASTPILWVVAGAVASKGAALADPKCFLIVMAGVCMLAGACGAILLGWAGQRAKVIEAYYEKGVF